MKKKKSSPFHKKYLYGGKILSLGSIIIDLQKMKVPRSYIDRYIQGLTHKF